MEFNTSVAQPSPAALDIKPPASPSPMEIIAQMQEPRIQQAKMQMMGIEQQQMQMQMDERKAINEAYKNAFSPQADGSMGLDMPKLSSALAASGHGSAIPAITEGYTKYQTSLTELGEHKQKLAEAEANSAGRLATSVKQANNDPNLFHTGITEAINRGVLPASVYAPLDQQIQKSLQDDPSGEQARKLIAPITERLIQQSPEQQKLINDAKTAQARQTTADTGQKRLDAEMPGIQAGSLIKQQESTGTKPVQPYEQAQLTNTAQAHTETARHNAVEERQGAGRLGVEAGRLQVEKDRYGLDANGGVSPQAQMAAEGRMDPRTVRMMLRSNPGLAGQIRRVDPNWSEDQIEKRYDTLKEFNSTTVQHAGGQALALNTLIHHADLYQQVGEALKNGSFRPGNALYNTISTMMGRPAPTNAALVAQFLAGETGKVATGGVPAEGEINKIIEKLRSDNSPDQFLSAGNTLLQIASGRLIPLQERVNDAGLQNVVHILGNDAKEILQRRGFDPNTMKPAGAGNNAGGPPPLPSTLSAADKGKVYVNKNGQKIKITEVNPTNPKQFKFEVAQ